MGAIKDLPLLVDSWATIPGRDHMRRPRLGKIHRLDDAAFVLSSEIWQEAAALQLTRRRVNAHQFEDRRRNAQRIADRDSLPPFGGPDGGLFEYPGMGVSTFRIETGYDTVDPLGTAQFTAGRGFLFDQILVSDGIPFSVPLTFGELPFAWLEAPAGTFDFSFPTP